MRFVVYEDQDHEWRWRLVARNGRIIADSAEGYARKRNAVRAVDVLLYGLHSEMPVEVAA